MSMQDALLCYYGGIYRLLAVVYETRGAPAAAYRQPTILCSHYAHFSAYHARDAAASHTPSSHAFPTSAADAPPISRAF